MDFGAMAQAPAMAHGTPTASGHGQAKPGEIAIGVIIGRTSEFFDFFVYAIASVIVFPKLVFPFVNELTGTLYSFGIFALAFAARPLGTVIFAQLAPSGTKGEIKSEPSGNVPSTT